MNIFFRELHFRLRGQIIWAASIVVFMLLSMTKFNTLSTDASASQALLDQFPDTLKALFGMTGLDIMTISGYYGVLFIYIAVMLAIHAGLLGSGVLADEERDKTAEFLYVKPRSRRQIITQKLLAGLVYVVVMWSIVFVLSAVSTMGMSHIETFLQNLGLFMTALLIIQLVIFFAGSFFAAVTKRPHLAAQFVAIVVGGSYLLFALQKLSPALDWLRYVSLFTYFDAASIIDNSSLSVPAVVVCLVFTGVFAVGTYIFYRRRDLNV
jgi:ABC-2 type transport system permease protein